MTFDAAHCVHMLSFWLITNYAFLQQTTSKKNMLFTELCLMCRQICSSGGLNNQIGRKTKTKKSSENGQIQELD